MNAFEKFNQAFGFTPNERRVILFLVLAFVTGGIIKVYKNSAQTQQQFNYSSADSEFAAKSASIAQAESTSVKIEPTVQQRKGASPISKARISSKINLNTATKEELMKLPGVGEATAEQIMNYREEHGIMKSINDLMNVKGIGKKKFERMAPFLTVGK